MSADLIKMSAPTVVATVIMLRKKETEDGTVLEVVIWPEPYCYAKTEEAKKQRMDFTFSQEGVMEAADWLNEQYEVQKALWEISF